MVLKLHGVAFATCTKRVALVLAEKKVPFEFVTVDFGSIKSPEYREKQPFGQIPYLVRLFVHNQIYMIPTPNLFITRTTMVSFCTRAERSLATSLRNTLNKDPHSFLPSPRQTPCSNRPCQSKLLTSTPLLLRRSSRKCTNREFTTLYQRVELELAKEQEHGLPIMQSTMQQSHRFLTSSMYTTQS